MQAETAVKPASRAPRKQVLVVDVDYGQELRPQVAPDEGHLC